MLMRKVTYRLYPNTVQEKRLEDIRLLHCRLYNTALEERKKTYLETGKGLTFNKQCKELTAWRKYSDGLSGLNAQSSQVTLKRLDLAFKAFFKRIKTGQKPGFPRFKSPKRFSGWGYKTHGDGWKLHAREKHGLLYLQSVGMISIRGKARNTGTPKTCEIMKKQGKWYVSVTLECTPERNRGTELGAYDWGIDQFLTVATPDGMRNVDNPRFLKRQLKELKRLGRICSRKERMAQKISGKTKGFPISVSLRKSYQALARLHGKIARQRKDFLHQVSARLIDRFAVLATEKLNVKAMATKGGRRKKGLNREILSGSPSVLNSLIRHKAEEAGAWFVEAPTKQLKPTQRCHNCWSLPKQKKTLSDRIHACSCGTTLDRDENAARVLLRWVNEKLSGQELSEALSGVRPHGLSEATAVTCETLTIA